MSEVEWRAIDDRARDGERQVLWSPHLGLMVARWNGHYWIERSATINTAVRDEHVTHYLAGVPPRPAATLSSTR